MKILVVSNLYRPHYMGGYELRCAQVAEALQRSGHDVVVLTSVFGLPLGMLGNIQPQSDEVRGIPVHRRLNQYAWMPQPARRPWTLFQAKRELWDARQFLEIVTRFQPDIVNFWNIYGLSRTILAFPHLLGIPDIHWIEDKWMIEGCGSGGEKVSAFWINLWEGNWGPRICRFVFRLAGRRWEKRVKREGIPTRSFLAHPRHVCFISEYMRTLHREAGLEFSSSEIIYGGVPTEQFYDPIDGDRHAAGVLRLLYAGQITHDRGLHTAVEAVGCIDPILRSRLTLTVAGEGSSGYLERVKAQVEELGLTDCVSFLGKVPHEQMADLYKRHDVLIFPSTRAEGLPLTMVEAMLARCAVLTTGSGGAMEIARLADLPLFPKNDPGTLSRLLTQFLAHRPQLAEVALRGQTIALQQFSFDRMMERFSATLRRIHGAQAGPDASGSSMHRFANTAYADLPAVAADQALAP